MEKGFSFSSKYIVNYLTQEMLDDIDLLTLESKNVDLTIPDFTEELKNYYERVSIEEGELIRHYTSFDYANINAVLRDTWTYEKYGLLTDKRKKHLTDLAEEFSKLISIFPPNKRSFIAYRGTTMSAFKKYGITTLEDLKIMEGKYLYENGFSSASLKEADSFYKKKVNGSVKNILVKYIVPANSQDGIPLTKKELSFVTSESEYLINKDSLSKVLKVELEGNNAIITAVLIPKKIWNKPPKEDKPNYKK